MKHVRAFTIYRDGFMLLVVGYTGKKAGVCVTRSARQMIAQETRHVVL